MKRLLANDELANIQTWYHYDPVTDVSTIETVQDVQPIIERNKELAKLDHQKDGIKNSWMYAACIPVIIQHKWLKEHNCNIYNKEDYPKMKRLLNDPEYRYLKVGNAKL